MARRLTAILLVVSLSGCSLFMRGVPEDHEPGTDTDCQPYLLVPIVDGIVGVAGTAVTIGGPCFDNELSCAAGLGLSLGMIAVAVLGYLKVKKCEKAKAQYEGAPIDGAGEE